MQFFKKQNQTKWPVMGLAMMARQLLSRHCRKKSGRPKKFPGAGKIQCHYANPVDKQIHHSLQISGHFLLQQLDPST